jgi:hypothetical protein
MAENAGLLILLAVGAYYFLSASKGTIAYRNMNGQAITEITCGNSVTFDVSGYTRVWLQRLKNGTMDFDQPFDLPMPAYILNCVNDIGVYDVVAYEIDANGVKGALIGQTKLTVLPQA